MTFTGAARPGPASIVLWTLVVLGAAAVLTVSSSLSSSAFGVPVAIALLLAGIQAAAMVLGLLNPPIAAALSVLGVLGFALVTPPGGPWPVMVTSMIAHVTVVLLVTRLQSCSPRPLWRPGIRSHLRVGAHACERESGLMILQWALP